MDLTAIKHYINSIQQRDDLFELLNLIKQKIDSPNRYTTNSDIDLINFINDNFPDCDFINLYSKNWRNLQDFTFTKNLIIIQLKDLFDYNFLRSFIETDEKIEWDVNISDQIGFLVELVKSHKDKNFLLLSNLEFLDKELERFSDIANLHAICIGGDILIEFDDYKNLDLVLEKQIQNKHVICLNNYPRPHRVGTVLYLLYKELDKFCNMSFISKALREKLDVHELKFYDTATCLDWIYFTDLNLKEDLEKITYRLRTYNFLQEEVWSADTDRQLSHNFKHRLARQYESSIVEIITESTCYESTLNLTEKYSNSIYGCNFPILISSQGTVAYLRELGFDVFDDIIDHSYDSEINPFYRLKKAIDLNEKIISDKEFAYSLWQNNKDRFLNNKLFLENKFYKIIKQKREKELLEYKNFISKNIIQ